MEGSLEIDVALKNKIMRHQSSLFDGIPDRRQTRNIAVSFH